MPVTEAQEATALEPSSERHPMCSSATCTAGTGRGRWSFPSRVASAWAPLTRRWPTPGAEGPRASPAMRAGPLDWRIEALRSAPCGNGCQVS